MIVYASVSWLFVEIQRCFVHRCESSPVLLPTRHWTYRILHRILHLNNKWKRSRRRMRTMMRRTRSRRVQRRRKSASSTLSDLIRFLMFPSRTPPFRKLWRRDGKERGNVLDTPPVHTGFIHNIFFVPKRTISIHTHFCVHTHKSRSWCACPIYQLERTMSRLCHGLSWHNI